MIRPKPDRQPQTETGRLATRCRGLFYCVLPAVLGGLMILLSRLDPQKTEAVYSGWIFLWVRSVVGLPSVWLSSLSLAGILMAFLLLFLFFLIVLFSVCLFLKKKKSRKLLLIGVHAALLIPSVILFLFALTCAPNYNRLTFAEHAGLEVAPSTVEQLYRLSEELIATAAKAREDIEVDLLAMSGESKEDFQLIAAKAHEAFDRFGEDYPFVGKTFSPVKPMIFSEILSHLRLTGFYFCYLAEPNVNVHMPVIELPYTICHELAHTCGFMREDEANFMAYLAGRGSGDALMVYSSTLVALNNCMRALYNADPTLCFELMTTYSEEMNADLFAMSDYWAKYVTPAATVSNAVNNAYLKANNQSDGVQSYGRMVDLMLADYRKRHNIS